MTKAKEADYEPDCFKADSESALHDQTPSLESGIPAG
jgi:hypothetical protein